MSANDTANRLLGETALWTASVRARESQREDRLFSDPWAAALAGEHGSTWIAQRSEEGTLPIVLRTRYFDDFLQRISSQHGIRQIVLMAAGLDTRAFRLNWPQGTRIFELDQPEVLNYKEEIINSIGARPTCERQVIKKDLTESWKEALTLNGFDPLERTCWLLEGFLFYLPNETVIQLIRDVNDLAASECWLGFDIINGAVLTSPWTKAWVDMQAQSGAPWIGTLDDPESFLASLGWTATLTQAGQADANYGRWTLPVIPTKMPNMPHNWFVSAQKNKPG
jgi:methyltransferase (TIGR00027 family)